MKIKFLSLNLWHGELIEKCVDFLAKQDADVVILQEVTSGEAPGLPNSLKSFELLKEKLNYPFYEYISGLLFNFPEAKVPEGNAIFSKFELIKSDHLFLREGFNDDYHDDAKDHHSYPHILQHVELETPAGQVNVFNLHGVWDLDGDNYSDRRQEMERKIISAIEGKPNVLLGGDTNAKLTNQAFKNIEKHLTSVFGESLQSTFNMQHKTNPGYATAAVDMLFVSPNIKILTKDCPQVDVSDHLPVWAELEIKPQ